MPKKKKEAYAVVDGKELSEKEFDKKMEKSIRNILINSRKDFKKWSNKK